MTFESSQSQPDPDASAPDSTGPSNIDIEARPKAWADISPASQRAKRTSRTTRTALIAGSTAVGVLAVVGIALVALNDNGSAHLSSAVADASTAVAISSPSPTLTASVTRTSPVVGADSAKSAQAAQVATGTSAFGTVSLPTSAGGLTIMTGPAGTEMAQLMKKSLAGDAAAADALFGAYEKSGSSAYFATLALVPLSQNPTVNEVAQMDGPQAAIATVFQASMFSDVSMETPPNESSAISCALATRKTGTERECAWMDSQIFAVVYLPASLSDDEAAIYTEALWEAADNQ